MPPILYKCQTYNNAGPPKAPMVCREIVTEPFERVCIDLVGPLPKARGGHKYLLTYICVATRWPEAIPLSSTQSRPVMEALLEIFSRNGLPKVIVSDQGAQLTGKVMEELCSMYGVDKIQTSPYWPQSNGLVERFHGTLVPLLKKCSERKTDWVKFLPLALYAIRLMPNSATGASPYLLVHGRELHSPVDLLYNGWVEKRLERKDVSQWAQKVAERVELLRESACLKQSQTLECRKAKFDKNARERELVPKDLVLVRTPGITSKLDEAWTGPWEVVRKCGPVTYEIRILMGNRKTKIAHLNTLKKFVERNVQVKRLCAI